MQIKGTKGVSGCAFSILTFSLELRKLQTRREFEEVVHQNGFLCRTIYHNKVFFSKHLDLAAVCFIKYITDFLASVSGRCGPFPPDCTIPSGL